MIYDDHACMHNLYVVFSTSVTDVNIRVYVSSGGGGGGGGTPYECQCTMIIGLDPIFLGWFDLLGSIVEPGSIP